jgi:hypothetical protein
MKAGKISYPGVSVAAGGVLGILGVFMTWFSFSYVVGGQGFSVQLSGLHDWSGSVALIAGFGAFGFGAAYVLLDDPQIRRITSILMSVSAAFLLFMPIVGLMRVGSVADVPGASTGFGAGLTLSFVGGVVAVVGSFLASRQKDAVEAAPAAAAESEPEAATTA